MRLLRGPLVLAILAALLGAPSIASAASNELTAPDVSPARGTVDTVFTFTVDYEGRFGATGVTVAVGGKLLALTRISGSPEAGTWAGSATLPAGAWAPLFAATVEQGGPPLVSGPTVTVLRLVTPSPTSPQSVGGDGGGGGSQPDDGQVEPPDPGGGGGPGDEPTPAAAPPDGSAGASPAPGWVAQTPAPTDAPDAVPGAGSRSEPTEGGGSSAGAGGTAPAGGTGGDTGGDSAGGEGGPDHGAAPATAPTAEPGATGEGWIVPTADEVSGEEDDGGGAADGLVDDGLLVTVVLIGLSGVAAVALIGTALLMAGRRRADHRDAEEPTRATSTEAVLHERMLRRAHVRLEDDDPIVAALGGDDLDPRTSSHRSEDGPPRNGI